jgi:hypothetical protein
MSPERTAEGFEEHGLAAMAALGHVMREARDDDAADARHAGMLPPSENKCNR